MAYDEVLAERVRDLVMGPDVAEQRMFGGLAFLIHGNMAVAASGQGGLLVRVDPDGPVPDDAEPMVMRGRVMRGWLRVEGDAVQGDAELAGWVRRGVDFARTLPPKPGK
ncbi:TfoX/Sxy family protein [Actinokineospora soli]|uniref:TfoX/Sxy family protein n=1 Tax=Actinokineospora soli TaxID=1048753 RepID=A0ABW2TRW2_9PSEU